MGIPHAEYTVKAAATDLRTVTCENCSAKYVYALKCVAEGHGMSMLFLDNEGAERTAQRQAQAVLKAKLASSVNPVACPKCGWF